MTQCVMGILSVIGATAATGPVGALIATYGIDSAIHHCINIKKFISYWFDKLNYYPA